MIIETLKGRLGDAAFAGLTVNYADIAWHDAHRKIARLVTRNGLELGLRLSEDLSHRGLRQDDVLYADDAAVIAVNIVPCACIFVSPASREGLVTLCYEIGNRHGPFFYDESGAGFLLPYDAPMFAMIEKLGQAPRSVTARLMPEKRISSAHGQHGHQH
ncbi:MAG: urease accessory protein UreE [Oscillospiraceae bacterium]|jgi:urease accessory protein|nr:urease accessory protein UreE [Oscillospiraceae bacterium]